MTAAQLERAGPTELSTLALAAPDDRAAMTEFVRRTSPAVWRICARLVDPASADDLAQETYVRAIGSLASFRGDASPISWLGTIARRVCAEEIEQRQRRRTTDARLRQVRTVNSEGPAGHAEIVDALASLDGPRREAFLLTVVLGLSYAEAAQICACPVGTIRSRVARARQDLMTALDHERTASAIPPSRKDLL